MIFEEFLNLERWRVYRESGYASQEGLDAVICWADFWRAEMPSGLDDWADKRKLDRGTDVPDVAVFELGFDDELWSADEIAWLDSEPGQKRLEWLFRVIAEMLLADKPSNVSLIPTAAAPGQRFALVSVTEEAEHAFMKEYVRLVEVASYS